MDMPKINIKQILEKLSVFKNNLSLLIPVIIAVVALLLFIPTQLISSRLNQRVEEDSIKKLANQIGRYEKTIVPKEQFEKEAERQKAHANDANEIELLAIATTQRELLSYDLFPEPDPNGFSGLVFQQFGQQYRAGIEKLVAGVNGRDCPTDVELQRGLQNASGRSATRRGAYGGGAYGDYGDMGMYSGGGMGGLRTGVGIMGQLDRVIIDQMCEARAREISVYVNPITLAGYEYWSTYKYEVKKEEAVANCWYHQLGYWVIEDIFDTMAAMNAGYDNVLTAPVKRFETITFTMGMKRPGAGGGTGGVNTGFNRRKNTQQNKKDDSDKPAYMLKVTEGLTESCTGRFSDVAGDIDVIHFSIAVIVSAKDVLPFMQQLCSAKQHKFRGYPDGTGSEQTFKHNQITILESSIKAISLTGPDHRYYSYGDENVVELSLVCEYIFNKKGYEPIVPETVKTTLAGEATQ